MSRLRNLLSANSLKRLRWVLLTSSGLQHRSTSTISSDPLLDPGARNNHDLSTVREQAVSTLQRFEAFRKQNGTKSTVTSGVLVPICVFDDRLSLLYTLRSGTVASHRRQVSFPGGMYDKGDGDLVATALRETEEEIGLHPSVVDIWGNMHPLMAGSGKLVIPTIGFIGNVRLEELRTNPDEVDTVFVISLGRLLDPTLRYSTKFRQGYSMPVFLGGQYRVWGVTSVITDYLLHVICGSEIISQNIKSRKFWS